VTCVLAVASCLLNEVNEFLPARLEDTPPDLVLIVLDEGEILLNI